MKTIRITLKEGGVSTVMNARGEQIASLILLPEKGRASVENRKGEWENEACIDCNQTYRE